MKYLFFLILLPFQHLGAQSYNLSPVMDVLTGKPLGSPALDCNDPAVTPQCSQITDKFCQDLHEKKGHVSGKFGDINLGRSQKSNLSEMERQDLLQLSSSAKNLGPELKALLALDLSALAVVMKDEADSKDWYKKVSGIRQRMASKINALAQKIATENLKLLTKTPTALDQSFELSRIKGWLQDQITEAKLKGHPNWTVIDETFNKVKLDMIVAVNALPLTPDEKLLRIEKINETALGLPIGMRASGDIAKIIQRDCRSNMVNAFYNGATKSLTICSGLMNAFRSESSLYFVLAHELAHSFNYANLRPSPPPFMQDLVAKNGKVDCAVWNSARSEILRIPEKAYCDTSAYAGLVNCLNKNQALSYEESLKKEEKDQVEYFKKLNFCEMSDPKQGLTYRDPKEFIDRNYGKMLSDNHTEFVGGIPKNIGSSMLPAYFIAQDLNCHPGTSCEEFVTELKLVFKKPPVEKSSKCLRDELRSVENEADWYAQKVFVSYLKRKPDIRDRREAVGSSVGVFCGYTYLPPEAEAQRTKLLVLALTLKAESEDVHAEDDPRRNALMTKEMAKTLSCESKNAGQSYQDCKL